MSNSEDNFGTPEREDRPRRDGQGYRGNRSEGSREERPNRYGVPRDGQSRPQRDGRSAAGRSERPTYGDRASRPDRSDRPGYADRGQRGERSSYGDRSSSGDRPPRGDRPRYGDRPQRPSGDRPRYGDRDGKPREERPYRPSGDRPSYGDRGDRNARPERGSYGRGGSNGVPRGERPGGDRGGRPPYGDRPQRSGDRPTYSDRGSRPVRNDRSSYSDRPRGDRSSYGDRGPRPERSERSERPAYGDRPRGDRPTYGDRGPRPQRDERRSSGDRTERPRFGERGGRTDRPGAPRSGGRDGGRSERNSRFEEPELTEEQRMARELRMVRPHHEDPWIDDDVTDDMLDKGARNELKTLTKENAERVAKHLVMAVRLMDENPELAHQHVLSAARRAGRIAIVRETLGITAYATGDFALALRELRTYRRISGSNEQIALMVDAERGVGRPDKGLELGRSVDRSTLSESTQVALAIAMSGARLDLDQVDLALAELEIPQLDPSKAFTYSPALFHAYAEVLQELGRHQEAAEWTSCAEVAERALVSANLMESSDEDEQDIVVFEEELEEEELELVSEGLIDNEGLALADVISSGVFEESDSAELEMSPAEEDALISEGISPDDLLEDDVRQILIETAHLDAEGDRA